MNLANQLRRITNRGDALENTKGDFADDPVNHFHRRCTFIDCVFRQLLLFHADLFSELFPIFPGSRPLLCLQLPGMLLQGNNSNYRVAVYRTTSQYQHYR